MGILKQHMQKWTVDEMSYLDQKRSNLCVAIATTHLLRYAITNDLAFVDEHGTYSLENILATITMIVYPRSMSGKSVKQIPIFGLFFLIN